MRTFVSGNVYRKIACRVRMTYTSICNKNLSVYINIKEAIRARVCMWVRIVKDIND